MKERPILFSGEMVRAILDGRKTQTRRVIKPSIIQNIDVERDKTFTLDSIIYDLMDGLKVIDVCPYGKPGDRLWVRETWKYGNFDTYGIPYIMYREDLSSKYKIPPTQHWIDRVEAIWKKLSDPKNDNNFWPGTDSKWRTPIFMPRWASRITLEITDIRVEKVHEAGVESVLAEGIQDGLDLLGRWVRLWDSINAKRGYAWDSNPWVWVIEFKRIKP